MYNTAATYDENYIKGPDPRFVKGGKVPIVKYTENAKYEFLGCPLHIPFGVAAGPLLNAAFVRVALNAGFCMPVYKTVRSLEWKSNAWPNILTISANEKSLYAENNNLVIGRNLIAEDFFSRNLSISNSFGVPSQKPAIWQKDFIQLCDLHSATGRQIVLSFQGSRMEKGSSTETKKAFYEDIIKVTQLVLECVNSTNSSTIEINLSCPNEVQSPLYKDIQSSVEVIHLVNSILMQQKKKINLIAKIGVLSEEDLNRFIGETAGKINAISAINTVSAEIRKPNGEIALGSGTYSGGICGALIFQQGLQMVSRLAKLKEKHGLKSSELSIIGVGGVMSAEHFSSYLSAGANIVHAATGMMWNLNLAAEIAEVLKVPFEKSWEVLS
ncbi:hypothetical protein QEJ31_01130 [Pigmentibacter sp. JX0631]|uniref:hypothetical protein n=1 Tax=Pigmentibacter sp. JX0631 TaxID=2976982 RepID=UPI002469B98D|nr:hypothetical protein [Pigmentibacter sp. JX0631]WGL60206.1 hypothetical protein QEJ31_01130 [Pigmentibacter sp. JX0631]